MKNGELTLDQVLPGSQKKVWWFLSYDDPITGKHFDFEWRAVIQSRTLLKVGCPYLTNQAVWAGFNDLATRYPEIAAEWHPVKNGALTPDQVVSGSTKKVWWFLPYDDPITGKHFDFEWRAPIMRRTLQKSGCPYLTNTAVWAGFNDLATRYPEIAAEWHPLKNGALTPDQALPESQKKVWWFLPYDDPITGKHFDFEWSAVIQNRTLLKMGCPYLTKKAVWAGFSDLATRYPEIAAQWHPTKNKGVTPDEVMAGSKQWAWWIMPYDDPETGNHYVFEWVSRVANRIRYPGCPFLTGKMVWTGYNDLQTNFPEIASEWHPERNKTTPDKIARYSNKTVWWKCKHGHEWKTFVVSRTRNGYGCPECNKIRRKNGIWTDEFD